MILALSATLVFGAVTVLLVRTRVIDLIPALIVGLFGFTLASSQVGAIIRAVLTVWFTANQPKTGIPAPVISPTTGSPGP